MPTRLFRGSVFQTVEVAVPHIDWNAVLTFVVGLAVVIIRQAVNTPSDAERAQQLRHLADDAAAVVLSISPGTPYETRVKDVVARLAPTAPTSNPLKVRDAAVAALVRLDAGPRPTPITGTR